MLFSGWNLERSLRRRSASRWRAIIEFQVDDVGAAFARLKVRGCTRAENDALVKPGPSSALLKGRSYSFRCHCVDYVDSIRRRGGRYCVCSRRDRDMTDERLTRLTTSAIGEARKLLRIFVYVWVVLTLLSLHRAIILHDEYLSYHQGFALINALALAKVVLLLEDFHLLDRFRNRPLIYSIIFKSTVTAAILFCFHAIEETIIDVLHGKALSESIPDVGGNTARGMFMVGIIAFVVLIPFFAFAELERAMGPKELSDLLFGHNAKGDAVPPASAGQEKP